MVVHAFGGTRPKKPAIPSLSRLAADVVPVTKKAALGGQGGFGGKAAETDRCIPGSRRVIGSMLFLGNFLEDQFSVWPDDREGDANGCTVEFGSAPSALSLSLTEL